MPRTIAMLILATALGGCAHPYNVGIAAADGSTVALDPGQTASLASGRLRYVRVVADSRCPPDVQCVWAGDAAIKLQWTGNAGDARTVTLHSNPQAGENAATLGGRKVSFAALARGTPRASLRIDRAD